MCLYEASKQRLSQQKLTSTIGFTDMDHFRAEAAHFKTQHLAGAAVVSQRRGERCFPAGPRWPVLGQGAVEVA
jgi:hypothetical protein